GAGRRALEDGAARSAGRAGPARSRPCPRCGRSRPGLSWLPAVGARPREAGVGYVERHLLPNERVLYKTRLHWILFAKAALLLLVGLVLTAVLWRGPTPPPRCCAA